MEVLKREFGIHLVEGHRGSTGNGQKQRKSNFLRLFCHVSRIFWNKVSFCMYADEYFFGSFGFCVFKFYFRLFIWVDNEELRVQTDTYEWTSQFSCEKGLKNCSKFSMKLADEFSPSKSSQYADSTIHQHQVQKRLHKKLASSKHSFK